MQLEVAFLGRCTCTVVITDIGCRPYLRYNIKLSFYFEYSQTQRSLNTCQKGHFSLLYYYSVMRSSGYVSLGIQVQRCHTSKAIHCSFQEPQYWEIHKCGHLLELPLNVSGQNFRGAHVLLVGNQTPLSSSVIPAMFANKPRGEMFKLHWLEGQSFIWKSAKCHFIFKVSEGGSQNRLQALMWLCCKLTACYE